MRNTDDLDAVYRRLDEMQKKYLEVLRRRIQTEPSTLLRLSMKDMAGMVSLDIRGRETLAPARRGVSRVGLSEEAYTAFLLDMTTVLALLSGCDIPGEAREAYAIIGNAVAGRDRLSLRDVFSCVSITLTVVSLCLPQMEPHARAEAAAALDRILAMKERCLKKLGEKWRGAY